MKFVRELRMWCLAENVALGMIGICIGNGRNIALEMSECLARKSIGLKNYLQEFEFVVHSDDG